MRSTPIPVLHSAPCLRGVRSVETRGRASASAGVRIRLRGGHLPALYLCPLHRNQAAGRAGHCQNGSLTPGVSRSLRATRYVSSTAVIRRVVAHPCGRRSYLPPPFPTADVPARGRSGGLGIPACEAPQSAAYSVRFPPLAGTAVHRSGTAGLAVPAGLGGERNDDSAHPRRPCGRGHLYRSRQRP